MIGPDPLQADSAKFSPGNRRRLSAPAIRTFVAIADLWGLSAEQRRALLGDPSPSAFYYWRRRAREHGSLTLSVDVLMRISAVLGIHAALRELFATDSEASGWLRTPHQAVPFNGRPPLDFLVGGALYKLLQVRRFLDAARAGLYMPPNAIDIAFAPYEDFELVFREMRNGDADETEGTRPNLARAAAESAAAARTAPFREEMSEKAGGMYDRAKVADFLGVSVSDVDEQYRARQLLGVPYAPDDIRFPVAQFKNGSILPDLAAVLAAFGDMGPWGQLQLLVSPLEGFTGKPASIFDILGGGVDDLTFSHIISLVRGGAS